MNDFLFPVLSPGKCLQGRVGLGGMPGGGAAPRAPSGGAVMNGPRGPMPMAAAPASSMVSVQPSTLSRSALVEFRPSATLWCWSKPRESCLCPAVDLREL